MNSLDANIRNNKTKGELNSLRNNGNVPAIIYGGEAQNETISISKKLLKSLIDKENFLSSIVTLNVDGKTQNVLPKEIKYDIVFFNKFAIFWSILLSSHLLFVILKKPKDLKKTSS